MNELILWGGGVGIDSCLVRRGFGEVVLERCYDVATCCCVGAYAVAK